jgi:exonuclease III
MKHAIFSLISRKTRILLVLVCSTLVCTCGCFLIEEARKDERLRVVSWNVQNLFDSVSDGGEYPEYDPDIGNWSSADYHGRLETLCGVLTDIDADVILLQEIEHQEVLSDMCRWFLNGYSSADIAACEDSGFSTTVGIISRLPIMSVSVHQTVISGGLSQRPMLEADVLTAEGIITVFSVHWKSRIGGEKETEQQRRGSSLLLRSRIDQLLESHPERLVLAAGDLNTSIADTDASIPVSQRSLVLAGEYPVLRLSGDRKLHESGVLYDFWQDEHLNLSVPGSYAYGNDWHQFDHLLGSRHLFDRKGYEFSSIDLYTASELIGSDGFPNSWVRYSRQGVSDHLPVVLDLLM